MSSFNIAYVTPDEPSAHPVMRAVEGMLKPSSRRPSKEGNMSPPHERVRRSSKDEPSTNPMLRALAHAAKPATTDTVCAL